MANEKNLGDSQASAETYGSQASTETYGSQASTENSSFSKGNIVMSPLELRVQQLLNISPNNLERLDEALEHALSETIQFPWPINIDQEEKDIFLVNQTLFQTCLKEHPFIEEKQTKYKKFFKKLFQKKSSLENEYLNNQYLKNYIDNNQVSFDYMGTHSTNGIPLTKRDILEYEKVCVLFKNGILGERKKQLKNLINKIHRYSQEKRSIQTLLQLKEKDQALVTYFFESELFRETISLLQPEVLENRKKINERFDNAFYEVIAQGYFTDRYNGFEDIINNLYAYMKTGFKDLPDLFNSLVLSSYFGSINTAENKSPSEQEMCEILLGFLVQINRDQIKKFLNPSTEKDFKLESQVNQLLSFYIEPEKLQTKDPKILVNEIRDYYLKVILSRRIVKELNYIYQIPPSIELVYISQAQNTYKQSKITFSEIIQLEKFRRNELILYDKFLTSLRTLSLENYYNFRTFESDSVESEFENLFRKNLLSNQQNLNEEKNPNFYADVYEKSVDNFLNKFHISNNPTYKQLRGEYSSALSNMLEQVQLYKRALDRIKIESDLSLGELKEQFQGALISFLNDQSVVSFGGESNEFEGFDYIPDDNPARSRLSDLDSAFPGDDYVPDLNNFNGDESFASFVSEDSQEIQDIINKLFPPQKEENLQLYFDKVKRHLEQLTQTLESIQSKAQNIESVTKKTTSRKPF